MSRKVASKLASQSSETAIFEVFEAHRATPRESRLLTKWSENFLVGSLSRECRGLLLGAEGTKFEGAEGEGTKVVKNEETNVLPRQTAKVAGLSERAQTGKASQAQVDHAEKRLLGVEPPPDIASLSDQELVEGMRLQSEAHFAELYHRYFQRIYNFVFVRMRNHAEAEEVVQETFLAVFKSFENYRGQSSLLSWIYGIAKNTTNNYLRRAKSQRERINLADETDLMPRRSMANASPDEHLDLRRFQEILSSRLGGLADWQTEIFEMRHFENLSIPEISARTTRSSDAVRSSLYRVKRIFFEAAMAGPGGPTTGASSSGSLPLASSIGGAD